MTKKDEYLILAEKYFVEDQLPVSVISKKLNITEKTLHNWKEKSDWQTKRKNFLKSQYNCYANLYDLLNRVVQKTLDEFNAEDKMPDGATLYFIKAMSDKLPKLKQLEETLQTEKTNTKDTSALNEEALKLVDNYLKGI